MNAAVTAYDVQREIRSLGSAALPVVFGVYDLNTLRIRALPDDRCKPPTFASQFGEAPRSADEFAELGARLAGRLLGIGDAGVSGEW